VLLSATRTLLAPVTRSKLNSSFPVIWLPQRSLFLRLYVQPHLRTNQPLFGIAISSFFLAWNGQEWKSRSWII
jgi:hypothetical protein